MTSWCAAFVDNTKPLLVASEIQVEDPCPSVAYTFTRNLCTYVTGKIDAPTGAYLIAGLPLTYQDGVTPTWANRQLNAEVALADETIREGKIDTDATDAFTWLQAFGINAGNNITFRRSNPTGAVYIDAVGGSGGGGLSTSQVDARIKPFARFGSTTLVGTADIYGSAVTLAKLANNAVDSSKIADGSIGVTDIGSAPCSAWMNRFGLRAGDNITITYNTVPTPATCLINGLSGSVTGLTTVVSNDTLDGNGTSAMPLAVANPFTAAG